LLLLRDRLELRLFLGIRGEEGGFPILLLLLLLDILEMSGIDFDECPDCDLMSLEDDLLLLGREVDEKRSLPDFLGLKDADDDDNKSREVDDRRDLRSLDEERDDFCSSLMD
jgi:hypothetical protein